MKYPVGWHLGNERPITEIDWQIMERVRPGAIVFLPGQQIRRRDIERVLELNPECHVFMRPYLPPNDLGDRENPNYNGVLPRYFDACLRHMDDWSWLPAGQKHVQIFNEQNMPRWSQWEGFGDRVDDMRRFNEWFCRGYELLKARHPEWLIGWTPLTPGNRDCYFLSDTENVPYYMHGPECAHKGATASEIARAIKSGPCYQSLMLADEYYAHAYSNDRTREPYNELHGGLRFARYMDFLPKKMDVWILEAGVTQGGGRNILGQDLIAWFLLIEEYMPTYRGGACLWILGDHNGGLWYDGDKPRAEVALLEEYNNQFAGSMPPAPPKPEPSPKPKNRYEEALWAIWTHRPDISTFYYASGWDGMTWLEIMQDWVVMTTERAIADDPVVYAVSQGWLEGEVIQCPPIRIDGRFLTISQFIDHVKKLPVLDYDRVFLHHTASDSSKWRGLDTLLALKAWYETRQWSDEQGRVYSGWTAGPHCFVTHEGAWLFTPLTEDGVGVYGHNHRTRHVEMVINADHEVPGGKLLSNTVAVLGALLAKVGLAADGGLLFHRDVNDTTCPGKYTTKDMIYPAVREWLRLYKEGMIVSTEERDAKLRNVVYNHIGTVRGIAFNNEAAFPRYARAHDLGAPLTPELYNINIGGVQYVAQGYARGIVAAVLGDWANIFTLPY